MISFGLWIGSLFLEDTQNDITLMARGISIVAMSACGTIGAVAFIVKQFLEGTNSKGYDLLRLLRLTNRQFRAKVIHAFRLRGYEVKDGGECGVDLEMRRNGQRHLVTLRDWNEPEATFHEILYLVEMIEEHKAHWGFLISSAEFDEKFIETARNKPIQVLGLKDISALITTPGPHPIRPPRVLSQ